MEFREEVEIMEEVEGLVRKKRLGGDGNGEVGEKEEEAKKEEAEVAGEHRNVFFQPNKGLWKCRSCDWTYRLSSPCRDDILNHQGFCQIARNLESLAQVESFYDSPDKVYDHDSQGPAKTEVIEAVHFGAQKDRTNEISSPKDRDNEKHDTITVQETNHTSNIGKLEHGLNSNGYHEVSNNSKAMAEGNETSGLKLIATITNGKAITSDASDNYNGSANRTSVDEIEEEKATQGKGSIEEYDLERILDEQETHDLYCPNCKSCITQRVILRKRKRTVKQTLRDEPSKKPQHAVPSDIAPAENLDIRQDEGSPDIFRCLSCFTFFIPTECGFNIVRLFEKKRVNESTSHDTSDNCGSWLLSCFPSRDSPVKGNGQDEANKPLLSKIQSNKDTTAQTTTTAGPEESNGSLPSNFQGSFLASSSVVAQTSSSQMQASTGKIEQETKPLLHKVQEATVDKVSSIVTQTSSAVSKISTGKSDTGLEQTGVTQVGTKQHEVVHHEQIPLSKHASKVVMDATRPHDKRDVVVPRKHVSFQGTTMTTSESSPFASQTIPTSEVKVQSTSETKIVTDGIQINGKLPSSFPQAVPDSAGPANLVLPNRQVSIRVDPPPPVPISNQRDEWDILKAVVYGGLVESITSLSVVSAAAASGSKTLDIFILGMANLIGGLVVIFHNLTDLKNLQDVDGDNERASCYWEQLGRRSKFRFHIVVAILSYILFGLLPPVIYGFSFRMTDNREHKMIAVASASLICIGLLALGKAHVRPLRTYIKTLMYYLTIGVSASGLSYIAGVLIRRLLVHFGLIDQGASAPTPAPPSLFPGMVISSATPAWASY